MVVDAKVIEACAIGVLLVRGFTEREARALAPRMFQPNPDKPLADLRRELASVFLTLQAHGVMRDRSN